MEEVKKVEMMEDVKEGVVQWDNDDDKQLRTLILIHGCHDWSKIASNMNSMFRTKYRTSKECKERWYNYLDPAIAKQPWTDKEELEMLIAHQKHQNKWSDVAQALNGRSNNTIKNRFYSIFRKVKNKIKRKEFTYGTELELLETFYMISLMEFYFAHPPPIEQKGIRGKDFIYSLLRNLRLEDVEKYKVDLQRQGGQQTTFEELWIKMANHSFAPRNDVPALPNPAEKPIDLFDYISSPPSNDMRHRYSLPRPHSTAKPEALTPDEKDFVHSQMFNREPCSAGSRYGQPMMLSPPVAYPSAPFSAGRPRFSAVQPRYEVFSDFTDGAVGIAMQNQSQRQFCSPVIQPIGSQFPHIVISQQQPRVQSLFAPMQFFTKRPQL